MRKLTGKIIIVTGASSGIGEASARRLAGQGASVVLAGRRMEKLQLVQLDIESRGGQALSIPTDITIDSDRQRLVQSTVDQLGRIDALINNAGFGQRGPIEMVPIENIRRNFETNFFSLIALTQLVIPVMRAQLAGRIVNIGSVAGKIARPLSSVYDSTKHALEAISDGLRGELAPFGIEVVLIEPGFIRTNFQEVARNISSPLIEREDSPYAGFIQKQDQSYKRMEKYAGSPEDIAAVVEQALTSEHPRARYAAPPLAKFFLMVRWLLSDRMLDRIVWRQMGLRKPNRLDSSS